MQVDVKFLGLSEPRGGLVKRFQYTAIDDATRRPALKIYNSKTQQNATKLIDDGIGKFPFRFQTIRTDNGHEFQAMFHWHVENMGIRHIYIKPRKPNLNRKVERSDGTDEREFYQLLTHTDDVELKKKLVEWEDFYILHRPHGGLKGKSPYEIIKEKLQIAEHNGK
jgi:transposase InsO family protein